jgi:hypothetical protein
VSHGSPWTASIGFGLAVTSGNAETTTLNMSIDISATRRRWPWPSTRASA